MRVDSGSGTELIGYFRALIRHMHHAFAEQNALVRKLNAASAKTVMPSIQSNALYANVPLSMSIIKTDVKTWWLPFLAQAIEWVRPSDYDVDVCIHNPNDHFGMTVSLLRRKNVIGQWHKSGPDSELANAMADLAYGVVLGIIEDSTEGQ